MIAARQIAFGGGKRKPYDAEIEYLESTGAQYIDTGVILNNDYGIDITFAPMESTDNVREHGVFASSSGQNHNVMQIHAGTAGSGVGLWMPSTVTIVVNPITIGTYQHWQINLNNSSEVVINGFVKASTRPTEATKCPYSVYLFARNVSGVVKAQSFSRMRLSSWIVYNGNGVIVQDLIPVRVGSVGYMYDKVSGKLFANSGTGEFVLGPDVARDDVEYTAKDYVQNGLVAMWDGKENAGWGVHDPSATVWKDLVGEIDVTANRTPTWKSDAFAGDGETYFTTNSTVPAHTILNGGFTVELGARPTGNRRSNGGLIGIGTNSEYRTFWMWEKSRNYNIFLGAIQTAQIPGTHPDTSPDIATSWQAVFDGSTLRLLANSIECINRSAQTTAQQEYGTNIGKIGSFGSTGSDILFARLYSRALTAEEIKHNYEIDKARFGL